MPKLDVAGMSIAWAESPGAGPAVLLVHGNSSSSAAWVRQLEGPLGKRCRLVALDLPGHGESAPLPAYSIPILVEAILGAALALACEDAVFVGHSLGGHLVLEAAPRLPKARGLVIFGTPPLGRPPRFDAAFLPSPATAAAFKAELGDEEVEAFARACVAVGAAVPPQLAQDIRRTHGQVRADLGRAVATGELADEVEIVRGLQVPLAILHGSEEQLVNGQYLAELTAPTLWRSRVQVVEGAGHSVQIERSQVFDRILGEFLDDLAR